MQKIYFEKWIDLNHQLTELLSLSVDESINYKIESVGVRAVGSLIVKGEYNERLKFDENIELDVLATFDKIIDQRDFNIKVEDFDYLIKDGNIQIKIEVGIHGVIAGEDRYVKDEALEEIGQLEEISQLEEIETLMRQEIEEPVIQEVINDEPIVDEPLESSQPEVYASEPIMEKETILANEISEQLQEKVYESKTRPIFQDSEDSVGTYYLYIVKENDSYGNVANKYQVDEEIIRNYNQNKDLEIGSVLIIPYIP